jgi:hypothetical protein
MLDDMICFRVEALKRLGYKINDRTFASLKPVFSEDYRGIAFNYKDQDTVYSGAEHKGKPKLPNVTFLPNMGCSSNAILGSTFGHQHTQAQNGDKRQFQEIYEFLGYGAMMIRNSSGTTLYVMKPGEKVVVGTADHMTIFNLGFEPLVTLDYANPEMNSANKDLEQRTIRNGPLGSLMMIKHFEFSEANCTMFIVNPDYISEGIVKCDYKVRKEGFRKWGSVRVDGEDYRYFVSVGDTGLGSSMYDALSPKVMTDRDKEEYDGLIRRGLGVSAAFFLERFMDYAETFKKIGITIKVGGNIPLEFREEFSRSLLDLAVEQNKTLLNCLGM